MRFVQLEYSSTMYRVILLTAVFVCVSGAPRTVGRPRYPLGGRIVGGTEVAIEKVPYQLSYEKKQAHWCGASIISVDWAITAAHCSVDPASLANDRLRAGSSVFQEGGTLHYFKQIIVHEKFDRWNLDYDISLLQVTTPFVPSANTAIIPLARSSPGTGTSAYVSGWGTTVSGGSALSKTLRWVEVPIYDHEDCDWEYRERGGVTARMLCAGVPTGGKDACQGDSGGPLQVKGELVGIVSWGIGCGLAGYPGVYSDIAVLRSWITQNSGV